MTIRFVRMLAISAVLLTGVMPSVAYAYIGPGAGISAIGTLLTLVGAVLLSILGFVWYPVKRLIKALRGGRGRDGGQGGVDGD